MLDSAEQPMKPPCETFVRDEGKSAFAKLVQSADITTHAFQHKGPTAACTRLHVGSL